MYVSCLQFGCKSGHCLVASLKFNCVSLVVALAYSSIVFLAVVAVKSTSGQTFMGTTRIGPTASINKPASLSVDAPTTSLKRHNKWSLECVQAMLSSD